VRGRNRWEIVNYVRKLQADAKAQAAAQAAQAGGAN
jgi:hypothetical protein